MYIQVETPRWHSRVLQAPSSTCPSGKVCVTDKGKFVGLNCELINLFQVDDLYGFLPWDSSPFFNCSPPFWASFELCMMIFQPPSQQILVNRLREALIQDLLLWRILLRRIHFRIQCAVSRCNLQDYTLFLYIYILVFRFWGKEPYLHLPYELYILIDLIDVLSLTQQSRHCV